jgi:hypothetical protein
MDGIWNANCSAAPMLRSVATLLASAPRDVALTLLRRSDAPLGRYAPRIRTYATSR